ILEAVSRMAPASSKRDPRPPVTLAMVDEALEALDPKRGFDQCVAAALLVAFWGQARLGEILSPTRRYDVDKLPVVKHLRLRHDAGGLAQQGTTAIWLPQTKTARTGEWLWLAKHYNDPSFALQEHIADNRLGREDPLFSYRDAAGAVVALTKNAFLGRLNEVWAAAGMQRVSGHCFRIGGTTALLRMGVDTEVVKMSGRWKSDAFLRYWRSVD
ncbi:DNA breaking-rejoining enzyme, partial [Auricularia subglabra TFB-10046 SS5]